MVQKCLPTNFKKNLPRISPCLILCTLLSEPWVKWKTIWNNWTWPRYVCVIWCNNSVIDRLFRSRVTILISQLPDKQLITTLGYVLTISYTPINMHERCWRETASGPPKGFNYTQSLEKIVPRIILVINIFIPLANIVANYSVIN